MPCDEHVREDAPIAGACSACHTIVMYQVTPSPECSMHALMHFIICL